MDRVLGHIVLLDKGYRDENFTKFMRAQGVGYIAIKRRNMIRDEKEKRLYRFLRRIRRIINRDKVFAIRGIRIEVYKSGIKERISYKDSIINIGF